MARKLTDDQMQSVSLEDLLGKIGVGTTVEAISEIYSGKDHECRCGGYKGRFFKLGDKSYNRILNAVKRAFTKDARLQEVVYGLRDDWTAEYINIPNGEKHNDHCYVLYFDK